MAQPLPPLKHLDPEAPKLALQWEPFADVIVEARPLLRRNHDETGRPDHPFEPDFQAFFAFARQGSLHTLTVRDGRMLVGYVALLKVPHLNHVGHFKAYIHTVWLDPTYRRGLLGLGLIAAAEQHAIAIGADEIEINFPEWLHDERLGKLFQRRGYERGDVPYVKRLK